jgi:DtxR family transcriptional regulator, manganese transport regulator
VIKYRTSDNTKAGSRLELIRDAHKTRKSDNHTTYRMEDYLEVIYELIQHKGYATSTDVADCLNISRPSVTKMMRRLDGTGLIDYEKYRGVRLTKKGSDIAETIHDRHGIVCEFLKMIGVEENIANIDAEEIEHHVHTETLRKLKDLLQRKRAAQS